MRYREWLLVRVIRLPQGEAPEEIRKQWLGVVLSGQFVGTVAGTGIITKVGMEPRDTFKVPYGIAIQALKAAGRKEASDYWRKHMEENNWEDLDVLLFGADEVEIVNSNKRE